MPPGHITHGRQGSWHRVALPELTAGSWHGIAALAAPAEGYPRWTAAGSVRIEEAASMAAVWSSADGQRWDRIELRATGSREAVAAGVTVRQGVAVVVGTVIRPSGDRGAAVWRSLDGRAWTDAVLGADGGEQTMTAVAAGPLGFVAAGTDRRSGQVPAVWRSDDGMAWTRVDGPFLDEHRIHGIAVGRGGVVAVGTIQTGGDVDGMAWFSADGSTWRTVPLGSAGFTGPGEQSVRSVTATNAGFVAVGHDGHGERRAGVVWTSADGIAWQRVPPIPEMTPSPSGGASDGVSAGAVTGAGPVIAVGGSGSSYSVWTSADGRRWTSEGAPAQGRTFGGSALAATDGSSTLVHLETAGLWFRGPGGRWLEVDTNWNLFPRPVRAYALTAMARTSKGSSPWTPLATTRPSGARRTA